MSRFAIVSVVVILVIGSVLGAALILRPASGSPAAPVTLAAVSAAPKPIMADDKGKGGPAAAKDVKEKDRVTEQTRVVNADGSITTTTLIEPAAPTEAGLRAFLEAQGQDTSGMVMVSPPGIPDCQMLVPLADALKMARAEGFNEAAMAHLAMVNSRIAVDNATSTLRSKVTYEADCSFPVAAPAAPVDTGPLVWITGTNPKREAELAYKGPGKELVNGDIAFGEKKTVYKPSRAPVIPDPIGLGKRIVLIDALVEKFGMKRVELIDKYSDADLVELYWVKVKQSGKIAPYPESME
jgi:hypothetical protein